MSLFAASTAVHVVLVAALLWTAFWVYVWIRYLPIVIRLIGEAPLLVAETSVPIAGGEDCEFRTSDGLTLRGSYFRTTAAERRGVIIFGHELNGDRWNAEPYVQELIPAGFDVLTFDFRNHGTSDAAPNTTLRPWITPADAADMRAALDYVTARPDADPRGVGILGISRGAGSAICAVAGDPRVRCLFTDGAYPTHATHLIFLRRYIDIYIPYPWTMLTSRLPDWVYRAFLAAARWWWGRKNGYTFLKVESAARDLRVPVLMVHGGRDTMIPEAAAKALRKCISAPSKLWVVPAAKHNGALAAEPVEYQRRLKRFFGLHLARRRGDARRR